MMIDRSRDFRIAGDHLLFTSTIGTLHCGIIGALLTKVPDFHWLPRSSNELPAASRTVTILKTTIHNAVLIVWFFTVFENIPVRLPGGGSGQSLQCLIPGIKCLYLWFLCSRFQPSSEACDLDACESLCSSLFNLEKLRCSINEYSHACFSRKNHGSAEWRHLRFTRDYKRTISWLAFGSRKA